MFENYWKYIPEAERAATPVEDFAGPHQSFPIRNQAEVYAAAHLYGKADDPEKVKAAIIRIARRKGFALPDGWDSDSQSAEGKTLFESELLICFGGNIKRLDDYKFEADLCLFTDETSPDVTGDFFNDSTDYDFEDGEKRSLYYDHGMDEDVGVEKIGRFSMKKKPNSVWMDAQINKRASYADEIMSMIEKGELGVSSGALSHLVRRRQVGKAYHLTHWPIGEGSLTTSPAEPRTLAIPLKSWATQHSKKFQNSDFNAEGLIELPFMKHTEAVGTAVEELLRRASWVREMRRASKTGRTLSKDTRSRLQDIHAGLSQHCGMLAEMCNEDADDKGKAIRAEQLRYEISRARQLGIPL